MKTKLTKMDIFISIFIAAAMVAAFVTFVDFLDYSKDWQSESLSEKTATSMVEEMEDETSLDDSRENGKSMDREERWRKEVLFTVAMFLMLVPSTVILAVALFRNSSKEKQR